MVVVVVVEVMIVVLVVYAVECSASGGVREGGIVSCSGNNRESGHHL